MACADVNEKRNARQSWDRTIDRAILSRRISNDGGVEKMVNAPD